MQSRMEKYKGLEVFNDDVEESLKSSRVRRNQELYKEVSYAELDNFDLNSNVSVLGDNTANIDISKIKDILEEKYNEVPRKRALGDTDEIDLPKINLDETREYDINSILARVKEEKEFDYEEDRLKKINEEAEAILKNIDKDDEDEEELEEESKVINKVNTDEAELLDLINTITAKELIREESESDTIVGEIDPLDILTDLRGNDDTRVMGVLDSVRKVDEMHEEALRIDKENNISIAEAEENEEEREKTQGIEEITEEQINDFGDLNLEEDERENDSEEEVEEKKNDKKKEKKEKKEFELGDSFIEDVSKFSLDDFDDFDDLKESGITSVLIKILIFLIILILIVGGIVLANYVFEWGLF